MSHFKGVLRVSRWRGLAWKRGGVAIKRPSYSKKMSPPIGIVFAPLWAGCKRELIMGIDFKFTCRECGVDVRVHYDTRQVGPVELVCSECKHVSGELAPNYVFRAEHRASWESKIL